MRPPEEQKTSSYHNLTQSHPDPTQSHPDPPTSHHDPSQIIPSRPYPISPIPTHPIRSKPDTPYLIPTPTSRPHPIHPDRTTHPTSHRPHTTPPHAAPTQHHPIPPRKLVRAQHLVGAGAAFGTPGGCGRCTRVAGAEPEGWGLNTRLVREPGAGTPPHLTRAHPTHRIPTPLHPIPTPPHPIPTPPPSHLHPFPSHTIPPRSQ